MPLPLTGGEGAGIVDEEEEDEDEDDAREEDELVRCTLFRGMNIRVTSSALIELSPPCPPLPVFHPSRGRDWKLGGDATAVIGRELGRLS